MQKVAIGLILTLLIVISLLSQKVEGMGFEVNAANPQYIIIEAYYGWNMLWVKNATDAVGRGTATRRLGIAASIYTLDWSDDLIKQELDVLFFASEKYDAPLLIHIDSENFWDNRPDLWNWWNSSLSGYNLANKDNVEWSDWDKPTNKSWLNWGIAFEHAPRMCFESSVVRNEISRKHTIVVNKLNTWLNHLSQINRTDLFIGIDAGAENGIFSYENVTWYNLEGVEVPPEEYKNHLGYCALSKRGFSANNPPIDRELELANAVKDFATFEAKSLFDRGIPKEKIFTHIWGSEGGPNMPFHNHAPMWTAFNDYSIPGLSLYPGFYNLSLLSSLVNEKTWATIESPNLTSQEYDTLLNLGYNKMIVIYGWGSTIQNYPDRIAAIKDALSKDFVNNAQFISYEVPSTVAVGQQFTVSIKMKNTGTSIWYSDNYKLGSQNPQDNEVWGKSHIILNPQEIILPGDTKTFIFTLTAPSSPGVYNFQWRMLQENISLFGDYTDNFVITVKPNQNPKGWFDVADCNSFRGWACDPDDYAAATDIHFYKNINDTVANLIENNIGLMGRWEFDEGSGTTAADSSGNGNTGNVNGASWVDGKYGKALSFDGVNDYVEVKDSNSLDITGNITIAAWVYPLNVTGETGYILNKGPGNAGIWLQVSYGGYVKFAARNSADTGWVYLTDDTTPLSTNNWHHVAAIYDRSYIRIYVNGREVKNKAISDQLLTYTQPLEIGRRIACPYCFNGAIDEVRIYNKALSSDEVLNLYRAFVGSTTANQQREQAVGNECGGYRNHGFAFNTPNSVKDGKQHTIYAYAMNTPAGESFQLLGSPKTITCATPTTTSTTSTTQTTSSTTTSTPATTTQATEISITSTTTQTNFTLPKINPLLIIVGILAIAVPIVFILIVTKI